MELALLVARLLIAAVFLVAGLAKLADRAGSRQALRDFGVPAALVGPVGIALPLAELAVAAALLPVATAWWGAVGALSLLLLFVAGIGVSLARGRRPDCHCFGQLHSEPVGWPTLVRNGVLASVAGFVAWQGKSDPGPSAVAWLGDLTAAQRVGLLGALGAVLALGLLLAQSWLLVQLTRQNGRLLLRLEALEAKVGGDAAAAAVPAPAAPTPGLPVGTPAPAFALTGLHGEALTLDALRAVGKPVLLLFSDPGCGPCTALLPDIARWQRDSAAKATMALISRGTAEANRAKAAEHGLTNVLLQQDREVAQAYQASGTPSAVLVRPDGSIGSALAQGADAIRLLVARTVGLPDAALIPLPLAPVKGGNGNALGQAPTLSAGSKVGDPAPPLALPDLDGRAVDWATLRGTPTLVLFWNPSCGFCCRMLDDLKAWEAKPPEGAPQLLVVSTGTVEANRAMGLRSPVALDQGFAVGRAFGASGTPSAVLVDAHGKLASEVAVGAPAVLALAGIGLAQGAAT